MKNIRLIATVLLLSGCVQIHLLHRIGTTEERNSNHSRIIAYQVVHNAPDHLALLVKYFYADDQEKCVDVGAITLKNGASDGYWSYRPDPALPGTHWAHILIGMNDTSPNAYSTDEIQLSMYNCGKNAFVETIVPFKKKWQRLVKPMTCHLNWGKGCAG